MANNICPNCKTENEPEYEFCKNCGKPLHTKAENHDAYEENKTQYADVNGGFTIDGNTNEEVSVFVGKNSNKIVPAFAKIEHTGSKIKWCWPPFILGIFFGPVGVAIWFLYRKMYSIATVFGGIAVILSYISFAFNRFLGIGEETLDSVEKYFDGFFSYGRFDYNGFIETVTDGKYQASAFLSSFNYSVGVACAVIAGIFGIYLYKRHTAKKINCIKSIPGGENYLLLSLASRGGTSVGAAILGTIIISFVSNIPETVFSVVRIIKDVIVL